MITSDSFLNQLTNVNCKLIIGYNHVRPGTHVKPHHPISGQIYKKKGWNYTHVSSVRVKNILNIIITNQQILRQWNKLIHNGEEHTLVSWMDIYVSDTVCYKVVPFMFIFFPCKM